VNFVDLWGLDPEYVNGLTYRQFVSMARSEKEALPLKGDVRVTTVPGAREDYYPVATARSTVEHLGNGKVKVSTTTTTEYRPSYPDHRGAYDLVPESDMSVYACASGVGKSGYRNDLGYFVAVEQYNGTTTTYSHLAPLKTGQKFDVFKGEQIATVGNSGVSSGMHLDVRFRIDGAPADPIASLVEEQYKMDSRYIGNRAPVYRDPSYYNYPSAKPAAKSSTTSRIVEGLKVK